MVFNSLQPTLFPNRLTMREIVSVLLSLAHSDYRSLGKWFTTIKTMSLLSARQARLFENSEMAGASRVSPRSNRGFHSASWTVRPVRCLAPQPYTQPATWLPVRRSGTPAAVAGSVAVSTNFSTRRHLFQHGLFQMVA